MDYSIDELMERLGTDATVGDAEAAWARAEDWYNATPKSDVLAWYADFRCENDHAPDINDPDDSDRLIADWAQPVIFYRAASLETA